MNESLSTSLPASIAGLRAQLQALQAQHTQGSLDARAFAAAKAPLERRLLDLVLATPSAAVPPARPSAALLTGLVVAVLGLAGVGYWRTGSPKTPSAAVAAAQAGARDAQDAPDAAPQMDEAQFAAAVDKLAAKLKEQPDNAEGWAMLARAYARMGRTADALPAFRKAVALKGDDARLLTDYADVLAVQNQNNLEGEPRKLIERALQLEPDNLKALALAGTAAFDRKDFTVAVRLWERLAQVMPADSGFLPQLQASLDQARELGGLPKAPRLLASPAATAVTAVPNAINSAADSAANGAANAAVAGVQGSVRLSPTLASQAAPDDTVFIFARAAQGPRMPLAILRHQVKDLPLVFKLDDSTAMAPAMRLSLHPQVVISARISKSGQAAPTPGDLSGQSAPVANTAQGLVIEINEVLKN